MLKTLRVLGVVCILVLLTLLQRSFTPASASSNLDARISRLEADNSQLRAQINRLESQVYRLVESGSRSGRVNQPAPPIAPPPSQRSSRMSTTDPMFDRLATLVIELKERIVALEAQVADLEKKVSP